MEDLGMRLSLQTLRLLHRYLDGFVELQRARSGNLAAAELQRLLRAAGADPSEIREILSEYRKFRETESHGTKPR